MASGKMVHIDLGLPTLFAPGRTLAKLDMMWKITGRYKSCPRPRTEGPATPNNHPAQVFIHGSDGPNRWRFEEVPQKDQER